MSLGISLKKFSLPACALSALLLTGCGAVVAEGLAAATLGGVLGGKGSAAKELVKDAVSDDGTAVRAAAGEAAREETEGTCAGRIAADAVSGDIGALAADSAAAGTGEAGSPADMLPQESPSAAGSQDNAGAGSASALSAPVIRAILDLHNTERRALGVRDLAWDPALAGTAAEHAVKLAGSCSFVHSGRSDLGENIFMGSEGYYSAADGVRMWAVEKEHYDYGTNGSRDGEETGHYTQMVWSGSERLGCAMASGCGNVFLVCSYYPAGNVAGERPY